LDGRAAARDWGETRIGAIYFKDEEIDVKVELSLTPRFLVTPIMAREMPAAIRPYSIAVAPDSSLRNSLSFVTMLET
jgi:hypothetical protein